LQDSLVGITMSASLCYKVNRYEASKYIGRIIESKYRPSMISVYCIIFSGFIYL
jgi:hypothetical protein